MGIISTIGQVRQPDQSVAFIFPDRNDITKPPKPKEDTFVFQYWPTTVSDSDETGYAEKMIPGGSHPLQQWVGGGNRTISFDAIFTSELDLTPENPDPNSIGNTFTRIRAASNIGRIGHPSDRYTVDVAAAIAKLRQYLYPHYQNNNKINTIVEPPKRLILVMPHMNLGHNTWAVPVILKSMSTNIESCFPSGLIRAATVSLSFTEVVQTGIGEKAGIEFVDRDRMKKRATEYDYTTSTYTGSIGA